MAHVSIIVFGAPGSVKEANSIILAHSAIQLCLFNLWWGRRSLRGTLLGKYSPMYRPGSCSTCGFYSH